MYIKNWNILALNPWSMRPPASQTNLLVSKIDFTYGTLQVNANSTHLFNIY